MGSINIDPTVLVDLCTKYMDFREARIKAIQEDIIKREMKPKFFGLFKGKTEKEAIDWYENKFSKFVKYHLCKLEGCYDFGAIYDLHALAVIGVKQNYQVTLSSEEASILKPFLV